MLQTSDPVEWNRKLDRLKSAGIDKLHVVRGIASGLQMRTEARAFFGILSQHNIPLLFPVGRPENRHSAVSRIRSIASIAPFTAVSNPTLRSVPGISLSMLAGITIVGISYSL